MTSTEPEIEVEADAIKRPGRKPGRPKIQKVQELAPGLEVAWESVGLEEIDFEDQTYQYRLSTAAGDLKRSLEEDGQGEPIDLLKGSGKPYKIIDGFRRYAVAKELGWPTIKAFVHDIDEDKALRLAFTKNVRRKNLLPMDRANALWTAQKKGLKQEVLTETFGITERQVQRYLDLTKFPMGVQKVLDGKIVSMAHAKLLADFEVSSPESWKKRIEEEDLSAKELKKALRKEAGKKTPGRKKLYLKQTKTSLRVYPFAVGEDTPQAEKAKIAKLLRDAIAFLEAE